MVRSRGGGAPGVVKVTLENACMRGTLFTRLVNNVGGTIFTSE